ncbi:hypothetical protein JLK41_09175 [Ectopseudomonas khazarica]|uniref:hypothetical protein n=1 Tax=Ectopseudomonas khazarica TaxID=2502979 RepID=UPI001AF00EAF|nr:hypothetical protein [Pseudomonas khazarica]QTS88312.1 hypothetical protein JLK41_09175 [Pseudomonas khazarica]
MADIIRIKRSDATSAPASLAAGELAYSEVSGYLYYGRISDGAPVIIGGKALKDKLDSLSSSDLSDFASAVGTVIAAASIGALADVDLTDAANGQVLIYRDGMFEMEAIPSGVTTFIALSDTPANFTGAAGRFVKVNAGASGLEFVDGIDGGTY